MASKAKPKTGEAKRGFTFAKEAIDTENRRVELAFSSELPYRRYFGMEVLGHGAKEVDLSRLADGTHPLLLNHDRNDQIGVVESARVDDDKVGRAVVRFSRSARGQEIFQDIVDGIRSQASVAYEVNEWSKGEKPDDDEDDEMEEWRAVNWTPYEISIVSIAADPTVGVGKQMAEKMDNDKTEPGADNKRQNSNAQPAPDPEKIRKEAQENERKRTTTIFQLGCDHNMAGEAQEAIAKGISEVEFQAIVLNKVKERAKDPEKPPTAIGAPHIIDSKPRSSIRSIGETFVQSERVKKSGYRPGDRINIRMELPDHSRFERATLTLGGVSNLNVHLEDNIPGIVVPDRRVLQVSQIFPQSMTSSPQIRYVSESSYTNAATAVAENAAKPAATIALTTTTATVEKIAVTVKVTDEMMADLPAVSGYVDQYLSYSVSRLEDQYLLSGSGSSNQITGVHNVSGIGSVSAASYATVADALDAAIENVRKNGNTEPNWFVLHPADWHNLRRTKDSNGQYYGGGPFTGAYGASGYTNVTSLWGIPAIITSAQTQGKALCGNFAIGSMIFRRMGVVVESTNSNEDDFLNNLVALRAEARCALATWKPLAFCEVTAIPA